MSMSIEPFDKRPTVEAVVRHLQERPDPTVEAYMQAHPEYRQLIQSVLDLDELAERQIDEEVERIQEERLLYGIESDPSMDRIMADQRLCERLDDLLGPELSLDEEE